MTLFRSILSVAGLLALAVTAKAQTVPDNIGTSSAGLPTALRNVGFEPPLNGQIPLSLAFRDELVAYGFAYGARSCGKRTR